MGRFGPAGSVNGTRKDSHDLRLDLPEAAEERVSRLRGERERSGFEALAWYQAHHIWSEETWGIYFDAPKLDDLTFSILQDLRFHGGSAPHHLAAFLAFGLTFQHELFHAQVEAASSWLELTSLHSASSLYFAGQTPRPWLLERPK
jgi:hypothetical protein